MSFKEYREEGQDHIVKYATDLLDPRDAEEMLLYDPRATYFCVVLASQRGQLRPFFSKNSPNHEWLARAAEREVGEIDHWQGGQLYSDSSHRFNRLKLSPIPRSRDEAIRLTGQIIKSINRAYLAEPRLTVEFVELIGGQIAQFEPLTYVPILGRFHLQKDIWSLNPSPLSGKF